MVSHWLGLVVRHCWYGDRTDIWTIKNPVPYLQKILWRKNADGEASHFGLRGQLLTVKSEIGWDMEITCRSWRCAADANRWGETVIWIWWNRQSLDWLQVQWLRSAICQWRRHHGIRCEFLHHWLSTASSALILYVKDDMQWFFGC